MAESRQVPEPHLAGNEKTPEVIQVILNYITAVRDDVHGRITRHETRADANIEKVRVDHETRVRSLEESRARLFGAILLLTTLGGFLGALATRVIK